MSNYLHCSHTTRLLSDRLERSLSFFERLCLRVHLLGCASCRRFGRALRWLHRSRPAAPADERLPAPARARIQRALEEAAREE
jgi:hypothetical protein